MYPASSTPAKFFVYDGATVNGVGMANAKTRLAEAYTCIGGCSSKSTDLGMSYSPTGQPSDVWELLANSGGYYHVNATYWANGASNTLAAYLASGSTFVPNQTYGVDGEGRLNSVGASSGPNPVLSVGYNTGSKITGITLGSNDSDSFTYDNNTGRMTQYNYTLNGSSEITKLTSNANGSLKTLAITDPFNAGDAQTCNYSYDDLSRITPANCA